MHDTEHTGGIRKLVLLDTAGNVNKTGEIPYGDDIILYISKDETHYVRIYHDHERVVFQEVLNYIREV